MTFSVPAFDRPAFSLADEVVPDGGIRTLYDLLAQSAKRNPQHTFCLQMPRDYENEPPTRVSLSGLLKAVERCAAWLVSQGIAKLAEVGPDNVVSRGSPVALLLGSDINIFIHLIALVRLGNPVILMSSRLSAAAIAHLVNVTSASVILTSPQVKESASEALQSLVDSPSSSVTPSISFVHPFQEYTTPSHTAFDELPVPGVVSEIDHNDRSVVILHSSGTTGLPKPIFHTHRYLLGYAACHELPPSTRVHEKVNMSTLPLFHGFGLLAPSLALSIGMTVALPGASTISTASSTLSILRLSGASSLMSVPSILSDIVTEHHEAGIDALKKLDFVAFGGAPINRRIGLQLVEAGVHLLNHWGATEIGAIAPIFHPEPSYNWRYLRLRKDIGLRVGPMPGSDPAANLFQLIGYPFGWGKAFHVQDALEANPGAPAGDEFLIRGRVDDLVVLATGEKVNPQLVEAALRECALVSEAIVFGAGQFQVGVIVEAHSSVGLDVGDAAQRAAFLERVWSVVHAANEFVDAHAKVERALVIATTRAHKPLLRTPKGNPERKANAELFAEEIAAAYDAVERAEAVRLSLHDPTQLLVELRTLVVGCLGPAGADMGIDDDFFERGMDSLRATKLRRRLVASLSLLDLPGDSLAPNVVYTHSTLSRLQTMLLKLQLNAGANGVSSEEERARAIDECLERQLAKLQGWCDELVAEEASGIPSSDAPVSGATVVLLTGSTGSLGCFLLAELLQNQVTHVVCLNRRSVNHHQSLLERQKNALISRGIALDEASAARYTLLEGDFKEANLGLESTTYAWLVAHVTHIVHNAWPMDFNRALSSFEPHIEGAARLAKLCADAAQSRRGDLRPPIRYAFASSIAAVGRYPDVAGSGPIPERLVDDGRVTDHFGYAEAKHVIERLLARARGALGGAFDPLSVRIGQLAGAEGSGTWSTAEHIPMILKSSVRIGHLPDLDGTLSWLPVNRAAKALTEIVLSPAWAHAPGGYPAVAHLENPARQPWATMVAAQAAALGLRADARLPFRDWVAAVRGIKAEDGNPAAKVLEFLEHEYQAMAQGQVVLATDVARALSPTLAASTPVTPEHVAEYVRYWKSVGFLG